MGRIKSTAVKRTVTKLFEQHNNFTPDFEQNKKLVQGYVECDKKIRNMIAGYITKKFKAQTKK